MFYIENDPVAAESWESSASWAPLGILARELRGPIGAIRGAVSVMESAEKLPGAMEHARRLIGKQVGQLTVLMDDLVELEGVARGTLRLRRDWIDLSAEVDEAVRACSWAFAGYQHSLSLEVPDAPVYAYVDPLRVRQVVTNLLDNACRRADSLGRVSVAVRRVGEEAVLTVSNDTVAVGRSTSGQDRAPGSVLGERAVRTEIGLTLVRELVALHGGTLETRGGGHGSAFVVRWPLGCQPLLTLTP